MGTGFDEFSKLSYHGSLNISDVAYKNRVILLGIMTDSGWDFYRNEWWHYKLFNSKNSQLTEIADSPFYAKTVLDFNENSKAKLEFIELSEEIFEKVGL